MTEPTTVEEALDQVALGMVSSASENGKQITQIPLNQMIELDKYNRMKARSMATHSVMKSMVAIPPGGG